MRDFLLNLPWALQAGLAFAVIIAAGCAAVAADSFFTSRKWARIVITVRERVQR